jgi:hypothetical protein
VCSEFAAVLVSLFAYFFYIVTAFTAIMGLLLVVFSGSTLDRTLRYPRPVIDHSIAATHLQRPLFMLAPKDGALAKNTPANDAKPPDAVVVANTNTEKPKHERPVHSRKIAARRENIGGRDYTIAQSYNTGSAYRSGLEFGSVYRPGLDAQR